MSPKTAKQNELIRQVKKQQIMNAALELFANVGYHPTSISDIAKKAGISKGLTYNYFESKEALLKSIMEEGFGKMVHSFDLNHDGVLNRDELILFITDLFEQVKSDPNYWRLYLSILMQPEAGLLFHNDLKGMSTPFFDMLTNYYRKQGKDNPEAEALLFHSLLDGICLGYLYHDSYPLKEIRQLIIERFV